MRLARLCLSWLIPPLLALAAAPRSAAAEPPPAPPVAAPPMTSVSGRQPPSLAPLPWAEHRRDSLPRMVTYKPTMPVFSGYHLAEERPRWPLAYGIPVFGLGYLSAVAATLGGLVVGGDSDAFLPILVPAVGPFIGLATADTWLESIGERALLVACAGFQLTGIGLTALHWALPAKKVLLLDAAVQIRPLLSPAAGGLVATF